MRQWKVARQVWAKPSVRDVLRLVAYLSWRLGAVRGLTGSQAARRNSGSGHEKAADAGLGSLALGREGGRTTACGPHALGGDQRCVQRSPDLEHRETCIEASGDCLGATHSDMTF